mgnify:CR=1 FL=1
MQIPFQIESSCKTLRGILHIPDRMPYPCDVVIMCYGMNGNRVDNNRISRDFGVACEDNEIVFCRFDYIGLGISDGEFYEIDLLTKVKDCIEVINFVRGCFGNKDIKITLIGFSDGIRLIANLLPEISIDRLIFWSPLFYTEKEYVDSRIGKKMIREPATDSVVFPFKGIFMNSKHLRQQMSLHNEIEIIKPYLSSSLIIFGDNDPAVIKIFRDLSSQYFGDLKNVIYIEGADHLYSRNEWKKKLFEYSIDFLRGKNNE